jgi:hypothetical protein
MNFPENMKQSVKTIIITAAVIWNILLLMSQCHGVSWKYYKIPNYKN